MGMFIARHLVDEAKFMMETRNKWVELLIDILSTAEFVERR